MCDGQGGYKGGGPPQGVPDYINEKISSVTGMTASQAAILRERVYVCDYCGRVYPETSGAKSCGGCGAREFTPRFA